MVKSKIRSFGTKKKEIEKRESEIKNLSDIIDNYERSTKCTICFIAKRDTLIIGCYHLDICHDCASELERFRIKKCPRCQKPYEKTQRVNHPLQ